MIRSVRLAYATVQLSAAFLAHTLSAQPMNGVCTQFRLMLGSFNDRRAALVIAHPGHELRVYNWLSLVHPCVFVLTDGSGRSHKSRLHRTTSILHSLGARPGSIYGRLTDAEIYSAILNCEVDLFVGLAGELAEALVRERIEYVVGDAIEGYNPAHDVCRLVTNAAVKKACQMGNCIENFDVLLAYKPEDFPPETMLGHISMDVSEDMLSQKLQAGREYLELEDDVKKILKQEGWDAIKTERLRRVTEDTYAVVFKEPPYYELYGEQQVAAGRYQQVIRYRDHVLPVAEGLQRFAEKRALVADSDY